MYSWNDNLTLAREVAREKVQVRKREPISLAYPTTLFNDIRASINKIGKAINGFFETFDENLDVLILAQVQSECALSPIEC